MSEGKRIAGYLVERRIGSGGMGEVWLARNEVLGRLTVLKKLRRDLAALDDVLERFEREARIAAGVHESRVVVVYDAFRFRGDLYIAQEYVDGADLRSILDRVERLPAQLAGYVALELARGLEAIHSAGAVHRDLKPANLLVSRSGDIKIADFGIARDRSDPELTQVGTVLGTPTYMSPEQISGERADARSDVFAVGVLLYEMLVGRPPYPDASDSSLVARLTQLQKERYARVRRIRREVPRVLARAVRACLRAKPARRPGSASELRRMLEDALGNVDSRQARGELAAFLWERGVFERREDETVVQVVPMQAPPVRRSRRRRLALVAAGIAAAVALSAGWIGVRRDLRWHTVVERVLEGRVLGTAKSAPSGPAESAQRVLRAEPDQPDEPRRPSPGADDPVDEMQRLQLWP